MNRNGFALAEMIVAITLLSLGLLTASGTAILATRWLNQARAEELAVMHAMATLDSLNTVVTPTNGSTLIDGVQLSWSVARQGSRYHIQLTASVPGQAALEPLEFELVSRSVR